MKNQGITMNKHSSQKSPQSCRGFSDLNIEREDAHPDLNSTEEFLCLADVDAADSGNQEEKELEVLGYAISPEGSYEGIALHIGGTEGEVILVPQSVVISGGAALHGILVQHGIEHHFASEKERGILDWMKQAASKKRVTVINRQGISFIEHEGKRITVYAWEGRAYEFENEKCGPSCHLTGAAVAKMPKSGTSEAWRAVVVPIAKDNPRLLAALSTTLSAATRRAFNVDGFIFGMTAPTSRGKTSIQKVCSSMIQKPRVESWDGTDLGNREYPEDCPDQPCCIDDVQQAKFDGLARVIMGIGNDSEYRISKNANRKMQHAPIYTTGIFSSEVTLRKMAKNKFRPGMAARYFEVGLGRYGMFDHSSGRKGTKPQIGKQIAAELKFATSLNYGTLWPEWLQLLEANWDKVSKWHGENLSELTEKILDNAKVTVSDAISGRLLDSIAFAAFMGCVATELGFWSIRKGRIIKAFALLFREYIELRAPLSHATDEDAVKHIAQYVRDHQGRFAPLSKYSKQATFPGYIQLDSEAGDVFLFDSQMFRDQFVEKFGRKIYAALKDGGFLVHDEGRNTFQKRIPMSNPEVRAHLVVVRAEISAIGME
jgi:hypothetical protein